MWPFGLNVIRFKDADSSLTLILFDFTDFADFYLTLILFDFTDFADFSLTLILFDFTDFADFPWISGKSAESVKS